MSRRRSFLFLSLLVFSAPGSFAQKPGGPSADPLLRIGTDTHSSFIEHLDIDADGRYILTVSGDKTARLWDSSDGSLLRIFRPPMGHGPEGLLFACALSPDGKLAAVGGNTGFAWSRLGSVYVFDTETGVMVRNISAFPFSIHDLEFSINGRYLAVALWKTGVRIIDTTSWTISHSLLGYGDICRAVAFDRAGRLATVCDDGLVRLYDPSFELIASRKTDRGTLPRIAAFSLEGGKLAVGFHDSNRIEVLRGDDLQFLYEPPAQGGSGSAHFSLCWSRDEETLFAGGWYAQLRDGIWRYMIEEFGPQGERSEHAVGTDTIFDIEAMPDGGLVYCSGTPELGRLDRQGGTIFQILGSCYRFNMQRDHLRISRDGSEVGFDPTGNQPVSFDVRSCRLRGEASGHPLPVSAARETTVTEWRGTQAPAVNGSKITLLAPLERCHSVDISDSGRDVLLGADWNIYRLDSSGALKWKIQTDTAWGVNIAGNERVFAAACTDGTIRWHRLSDGRLLLTLFVHRDGQRWVIWTPEGYFAASEEGQTLAGWHFNNNSHRAALFYFLSRFASTYHRPDVIRRVLDYASVELAVAEADLQRGMLSAGSAAPDLTAFLPPVVTILAPTSRGRIESERLELELLISTVPGNPATDLRVLVDGQTAEDLWESRFQVDGPPEQRTNISVSLAEGEHAIEVLAKNRAGYGDPARIRVLHQTKVRTKRDLKVVAVGISNHPVAALSTKHAAGDAETIAEALRAQQGGLYDTVALELLTDRRAATEAIRTALNRLNPATSSDMSYVVYLAGPLVRTSRGGLYFLSADADPRAVEQTALPLSVVAQALGRLSAGSVLMLDCSGGVDPAAVPGAEILTGTAIPEVTRQLGSPESGIIVWGVCSPAAGRSGSPKPGSASPAAGLPDNGAFVRSVVTGLQGQADYTGDGEISLNELEIHVRQTVRLQGGDSAVPVFQVHKPLGARDFPIAIPVADPLVPAPR